MFTVNKRVICKDGTSLSVQANEFAYCAPRISGAPFYTAVEVGYIETADGAKARTPSGWKKYQDGKGSGVYGYVPSDLVASFIMSHGGMVDGKLPPLG